MNPVPSRADVVIIGAGVVGCALAAVLSRTELEVLVLERADDVGEGTSKANTAILHTGFDCVPGSLESTLVTRGWHLLGDYAKKANIAVERTGALLVAWTEEQRAELDGLKAKAEANGIVDTRILDPDEVRNREPHLGPGLLGALDVPGESIIDPWSVSIAFAREALGNGATFCFSTEVTNVDRAEAIHRIETTQGSVEADWLINAAGLSSDTIDRFCSHADFTITPRRGELIVFDKSARDLVSAIILPVPTVTTKGVLVAPTVFGNLLLGPTAEDLEDRDATATTPDGLARLRAAGARLVPELQAHEVTATYAGLRAATEFRDYQLHCHTAERYVCVGGIRSTGLTASLAIAEHVASLLQAAGAPRARLVRAAAPPVMPPLGAQQVRAAFDPDAIAQDPAYGEMLCHCEMVSAGEIRDALGGELGARSLSGLRRRTRALNGRCQGFFCATAITAALAAATQQSIEALTGLERDTHHE